MSEERKESYERILSGGDVQPRRSLIEVITGRYKEGVTSSLVRSIKQYADNPHNYYFRFAIANMLDKQMIPYTTQIGEINGLYNVLGIFNYAEKKLTRQYARRPCDPLYKTAIEFVQKQRNKVLDQIEKLKEKEVAKKQEEVQPKPKEQESKQNPN